MLAKLEAQFTKLYIQEAQQKNIDKEENLLSHDKELTCFCGSKAVSVARAWWSMQLKTRCYNDTLL